MAREVSNKLIYMAENGLISWEDIARSCIWYMSEDDVQGMADFNDWIDREGLSDQFDYFYF